MMSRCPAWSGRRRAPRGHDRNYRQSAPRPCPGRRKYPHRDLVRTAERHRDRAIRRPEPPACSPERPGPTRHPCITRRSARRERITSRSTAPSPGPQASPIPRPRAGLRPSRQDVAAGRRPVRPMDLAVARVVSPVNLATYAGPAAAGRSRVRLTLRRSEDELVAQVRRRWARSRSIRRSPPAGLTQRGSASLRPQPAGTGNRQTLSRMTASSKVQIRVSLVWVKAGASALGAPGRILSTPGRPATGRHPTRA
jgi:hypothetical protein